MSPKLCTSEAPDRTLSNNRKRKKCVTQESVVTSKRQILNDRSQISNYFTPLTKLSVTSDLDSTSKDQVLSPYWTNAMKDLSKKLCVPTKTDYVDSHLSSYSTSFNETKSNSWCQIRVKQHRQNRNLPKMYWQSSQSLQLNSMDVDQQLIEEKGIKPLPTQCKKIKIFPTSAQKRHLQQAFAAARWTYNQTVAALKKEKLTKLQLRHKFVVKEALDRTKWIQKTPCAIRDGALLDVLKAIKSSVALHKNTKKRFALKFKSCKARSDSIVINGRDWKDGLLYPTMWIKQKFKSSESIPAKLNYDCRLQRTHLGEYHLCIPVFTPKKTSDATKDAKIIALDPGVRTFMTGFDSDNNTIEWGISDISRVQKLHHYGDKLQSEITKSKGRSKYRKRKALKRINRKITNLIEDCHKKLSSALCTNYNTIMLPEFQSSKISLKSNTKLVKKVRRCVLSWCHFKFRQKLINKAEMLGVNVIIVPENYTTRTCSSCGLLNNVGSSKAFKCESCKLSLDRDINAAKNIFIRACCERTLCAFPIGGLS